MYQTYRSFLTHLRPLSFFILLVLAGLLGCQDGGELTIVKRGEPLEKIEVSTQTAQFELIEEGTGRLIADGFSLEAIAQASAPSVNGEIVQATDVLFNGDLLLVSYNFKGDPHLGVLQVIDVTNPSTPVLEYEVLMENADLNRIRIYRDRYLVVASGTADEAASLKIFDVQGPPTMLSSIDLYSNQATMVTIHDDYALVTTGDDGGVIGVNLQDPSTPEMVFFYPLSDARYVEMLSDDEVLLVTGGPNASLIRIPWSDLTSEDDQGPMTIGIDDGSNIVTLPLNGLTVGAPSWGFRTGDRFHLSADERGLLTFSLANGSLAEMDVVTTEGNANAGVVESEGRFALLANGQEGLVVLDIQEGQETELLAQFDTPGDRGSANAVAMKGELVALADGLGGVKLLEAHLMRDQHELPAPPTCGGTVYEGTFSPKNSGQVRGFCDNGYSIISEDLIVNQTSLTSLAGLECLCEVRGDVKISRNTTLMNLTGLNNLRLIGENLIVSFNNSLRNFDALSSLSWIGEDLRVIEESSLANMAGLSALEAIGHQILLEGNRTLRNIGALSSLVWVGDAFLIKDNSSLASISGFNNLPRLTSHFEVTGNRSLRSIEGLDALDMIEGHALFNSNSSLQSINGLQGLREVTSNLSINGNRSLRNFNGLLGVQDVGGNLSVRNNQSLPNARAISLRDSIGDGVLGQVYISGNSP